MGHFQQGALISQVTETATAGGTTTLTAASTEIQRFTGTSDQTVVLPDATTLVKGRDFYISNRSTGLITVQYDDNSEAVVVKPNTERRIVFTDISTSNGTVDISTGSGSGSGSGGGLNLLAVADKNFNAEINVADWSAFNDGASDAPVDGTGGSPSGNLSLSRTTTSGEILDGVASFKLSKNANNTQGEGYAITTPVPKGYAGQLCEISFPFLTTANFAGGDASDVRVWLYDVTNSKLIQPVDFRIQTGGGYGDWFRAQALIPVGCLSLRLILHVATTNASAWDFIFDDVLVSPVQAAESGEGDIVASRAETNTTHSIATATYTTVPLDAVSFDDQGLVDLANDKIVFKKSGKYSVMGALFYASNSTGSRAAAYRINAGSDVAMAQVPACGGGLVTVVPFAVEIDVLVGDELELRAYQDSGGNLNVDSGANISVSRVSSILAGPETKDTSVNSFGTATGTLSGSDNVTKFPTAIVDTDVIYDSSTGLATIKKAGRYFVVATIAVDQTGGSLQCTIYLNGSTNKAQINPFTTSGRAIATLHAIVDGQVGDTLEVDSLVTGAIPSYSAGQQMLAIFKVPGSEQFGIAQPFDARVVRTSAQSISDSTNTKVQLNTKTFDKAACFDATTNYRYTAKVDGIYPALLAGTIQGLGSAKLVVVKLYKNGSSYWTQTFNGPGDIDFLLSDEIELVANDYVEMFVEHNHGSALNIVNCKMNIWRNP